MASFTDKTPTFNPYVQQLPVEAMVSVGMQKQKQYDEGIQKIQTSIDNIAGLDVMKGEDKSYLQSKLNQLGNNLTIVAAGDFSNYQLTNSVAGMASQIGKDEKVQNAVYSTVKARKEVSLMDADKKIGKLSPSNEYSFNKKLGAWLNDGTVGSSFNQSYIPLYDVDKHMADEFNMIKPDGYTIDQIYQTDSNGDVIYQESKDPRTGKVSKTPILSTTMSELKKKGIFPEKVSATLDHIFNDPRVSQQLQIDGEYSYREYTPEILSANTIALRDQEMKLYSDRISDLNMKKTVTTDEKEKVVIDEQIAKLTATKTKTFDSYKGMIEAASTNPDAVRGILYKNDERARYMSMYTQVDTETLVKENPAWKAAFEIQKESNDITMRKEDMRYKWASLAQDKEQFNTKLNADLLIAQGKLEGSTEAPTQGPIDSNIAVLSNWEENGTKAAELNASTVDDLIFSSGVLSDNTVVDYMAKHPNITREVAMRRVIEVSAKANGETPDNFRLRWHQKALVYLNQNPEKRDRTILAKVNSAENAERLFTTYLNEKKLVDAVAPDPDVTKNLKSLTVTITDPWNIFRGGGEEHKIILTPGIQYDIALATRGASYSASPEMKNKAIAAQKRLDTQGITKDVVSKILPQILEDVAVYSTDVGALSKAVSKTGNKEKESFITLIRHIDDPVNVTSYEKRAATVRSFTNLNPTLEKSFITGKESVDKANRGELSKLITTYIDSEQNESPNFIKNAPSMHEIAIDAEKGSIRIETKKDEVTGQITPRVIFSDKKGNNVGEMTITTDEANSIGINVSGWYVRPIVKATEQRIMAIGNGTTASGPLNDPYTYQRNDVAYKKSDFQYLGSIKQDVRGNIKSQLMTESDGSQYTVYYNYLYINDNGTTIIKQVGTPKTSVDEALQVFDQTTPQMISQILSEQTK